MEPGAPGGVPASAAGGHSRRRRRRRSRRRRRRRRAGGLTTTSPGDRFPPVGAWRRAAAPPVRQDRGPGEVRGGLLDHRRHPRLPTRPAPPCPRPAPAPARAGTPRGVGTAGRRMRAPESPGVKSGTAGRGLAASFRGRCGSAPEKGIIGMDASPHAARDARPRGAQPGGRARSPGGSEGPKRAFHRLAWKCAKAVQRLARKVGGFHSDQCVVDIQCLHSGGMIPPLELAPLCQFTARMICVASTARPASSWGRNSRRRGCRGTRLLPPERPLFCGNDAIGFPAPKLEFESLAESSGR